MEWMIRLMLFLLFGGVDVETETVNCYIDAIQYYNTRLI